MGSSSRRGLTLVECLVSLVASSVVLGGMLGLFTVADSAARSNSSDIFTSAMDYNLDRVLSEVGQSTSAGNNPTRRMVPRTGLYGDTVVQPWEDPADPSSNQILVYDRPKRIISTAYWTRAQGGPPPGFNPIPFQMLTYAQHPFPCFLNPSPTGLNGANYGLPDDMTNIDVNKVDANGAFRFSEEWLTGIVALSRRDPDPVGRRYRTGILWHIELPMARNQDAGRPLSFCRNNGGVGYPGFMDENTLNQLLNVDNPHLLFPGARVIGVGIQSFRVDPADPMSWSVRR